MAKWTVILTVIASCILGVLSQTDGSSSPAFMESSENNTQFSSSSNAADFLTKTDDGNTKIDFNSTSFPPLIHEISSKAASVPTIPSVPVTPPTTARTAEVTKEDRVSTETIEHNKNHQSAVNNPTTTSAPGASNILRASLMATIIGAMVCKFGF